MTKQTITLESVVRASPQQVSTELGSETVILGMEAGRYFGLNEVAARVWNLVQEPVQVATLCATLLSEYEVTAGELQQDVLELLAELSDKGLLDVQSSLGTP
jgi:hypothetical protein